MISRFRRFEASCGYLPTLAAIGIALLCAGLAQAEPLVIKPGYNFLATSPGSYTTISIPRGFFGEKNGIPSDAVDQRVVPIEGRPMGKLGLSPASTVDPVAGNCHSGGGHYHCHQVSTRGELVDTITKVGGGATLTAIGDSAKVPLQFVALSLQTPAASPLRVTYGGVNPSYFNLILTLDSSQPQPEGSIVLTRTGARGGKMVVDLPVNFRVSFSGGSFKQNMPPITVKTVLRSNDNTFTVRSPATQDRNPRPAL